MKRILLLSAVFFFCFATAKSEKSTVIYDILNNYVIQKVEEMQKLIKFSDAQAEQLKKLELQFLLDVRKAENRRFCNQKKRVEKLEQNRDIQLQQVLTRDQYIKYDAAINNRIKKVPLQS